MDLKGAALIAKSPAPVPSVRRLFGWAERRKSEIRLALRVTIAGTVTFVLARALNLPQGYWAVITAVIVVQSSIGGSVKAAIERSIGTLAGALYGGCVGLVVPHAGGVGLGAAVALGLAPLALLAAVDQRFRVAPVTALIVILTAASQASGVLQSGLARIAEIALGNLIGVAVSVFVLPARAHFAVAAAASRVVDLQASLLALLLADETVDRSDIPRLQVATRGALRQLETSVEEAKRERRIHLSANPDPEPLFRTLFRVRHDLVMIGRVSGPPRGEIQERIQPTIDAVREALREFMRALAGAMQNTAAAPPLAPVEAALSRYAEAIDTARAQGLTRALSSEAIGRVFALRFAFEQLLQNLRDLVDRTNEAADA